MVERKTQVILYGPPGTGKTHWAEAAARDLSSYQLFGKPFGELAERERSAVIAPNGTVRMCDFHPAYWYEDFIEGYRPSPPATQLASSSRTASSSGSARTRAGSRSGPST